MIQIFRTFKTLIFAFWKGKMVVLRASLNHSLNETQQQKGSPVPKAKQAEEFPATAPSRPSASNTWVENNSQLWDWHYGIQNWSFG